MASDGFRPDRLAAIAAAEDEHPWFVARRRMVAGLVARVRPEGPAAVVDVGCGTGRTLDEATRAGDDVIGIDLLADQAHTVGGRGDIVEADVCDLPLASATADVVLALDVLEHVEDDGRAMAEVARIVRPGGHVVLTVPAHPWLWSHRDDDAGHARRYRRDGMTSLVRGSGLQLVQVSWFAGTTLPVLAAFRLLGRWTSVARDAEERPRTGVIGTALRRALEAEARAVVAGGGPPLGSSIVVVARR